MRDDELKKFGWRLRPRRIERNTTEDAGHVAFDERGNAQFQWSEDLLAEEGEQGERERAKAMSHPGLAIADDEPVPDAAIRNNPKGLRLGYNPYESGLLPNKARRPKRDLHELSRWIDLKRRMNSEKHPEKKKK